MTKHRAGKHLGENVIDATHLFQREPTPEEAESAFWTWGREWIDDGVMNLEFLVQDVMSATTEPELRRALIDLRAEVTTYPIDD